MKKMLIVEGIATSGKSSLIKEITNLLGEDKVRVYSESETHMPIIEQVNELHIKFFKDLVEDAQKSNAELIIFDRLHFTQAYRAKADIFKYVEVEDLLLIQSALVVYLQVDEPAINARIEFSSRHPRVALSTEHSEESWGEHIKKKGQSLDEIAAYYIVQQRNQIDLLKQSKLKSRIFNTTHHEYNVIANQIINEWLNK
jgi:thymidylate kinase